MNEIGELTMVDFLNVERQEGEIGVELEIEGDGCAAIKPNQYWRIEHDGSLRGEACEIVLKKPCTRAHLPLRLKHLAKMVKLVEFQDSGRAGIHIHVNIQDMTPKELVQMMCLYMIFEETLVEWCGEGRVGNLFCLRVSDAPFVLKVIREAVKTGRWRVLDTDQIRYSSMNLKAIAQYGSLEFRALRSTTDIGVINQWIEILLRVKDMSRAFASPQAIIEGLSAEGTEGFFGSIMQGLPVQYNHAALISGVRSAQVLAYVRGKWLQGDEDQPDIIPGGDMRLRMDGQPKFFIEAAPHRVQMKPLQMRPGAILQPEEQGDINERINKAIEQMVFEDNPIAGLAGHPEEEPDEGMILWAENGDHKMFMVRGRHEMKHVAPDGRSRGYTKNFLEECLKRKRHGLMIAEEYEMPVHLYWSGKKRRMLGDAV